MAEARGGSGSLLVAHKRNIYLVSGSDTYITDIMRYEGGCILLLREIRL